MSQVIKWFKKCPNSTSPSLAPINFKNSNDLFFFSSQIDDNTNMQLIKNDKNVTPEKIINILGYLYSKFSFSDPPRSVYSLKPTPLNANSYELASGFRSDVKYLTILS